MSYKVITESDAGFLSKEVVALIEIGWQPLGGVSVCCWEAHGHRDGEDFIQIEWEYAQAMILPRVNTCSSK